MGHAKGGNDAVVRAVENGLLLGLALLLFRVGSQSRRCPKVAEMVERKFAIDGHELSFLFYII